MERKTTIGMKDQELIDLLKQQAKEIADANINGWGNTMLEAAYRLEKLVESSENDRIEKNIINILVNHKNGLEVGWLAKKLMGVEIEDHNYSTTKLFFYMDKIFDLAKEGKLKRKDYEIDIAIVSLWEIPDEDKKEGEN